VAGGPLAGRRGPARNLKELVVAMAEFENLGGFLEHVSLVMDNAADAGGDMVNLMTLHSAKGARIRHGVPARVEDGLFRTSVPWKRMASPHSKRNAGSPMSG